MANPSLLEGPIRPHLVRLGLPMAIGIALIVVNNLTDTFFVSRLGEAELTAMSFTFPIEGLVLSIAMGLSVGATATVARAIGSGNSGLAARLTTHACGLAMLVVAGVSLGGLVAQDDLARLLGAPDAIATLLREYMTIWYAGAMFLVVPLVGNGAMRADGDATTPMWIMAGAAFANLALDPVLIFGFGPVPALGMRGAALATVLSRAFVLVVTLVILRRRGLLDPHLPSLFELWTSWRRILAIGVPAAVSNALTPIATSLLTAILARFGPDAVAAFGVASRVEGLVLIPAFALGAAMTPFVGQNWGGHQELRVVKGLLMARRFVTLWGLGAWLVFGLLGRQIGGAFSDRPETLDQVQLYLWIVPAAYGAQGVVSVISSVFNAIDRAVNATLLSAIRSVLFAVPLAALGAYVGGTAGVFFGLALTSFGAGILASVWSRNVFRPIRALAEVKGAEDFTAARDDVRARVDLLLDEVTARGALVAAARPINTIGFFHQGSEVGHVHRRGIVDLHVPPALHDALIADQLAEAHRHRAEDQSWVSRRLTTDEDAREAAWMLGLLAALRDFRGGHIDRERLLELAQPNEPGDSPHTALEAALASLVPKPTEAP